MLSKVYDDLKQNGYTMTPTNGKRPFLDNWQRTGNDDNWVTKYPRSNVGIVLGTQLIGIDIDIDNEDLANKVVKSAIKTFGIAPQRVGNAPKVLLLYRLVGSTSKRVVKFELEGSERPKVEVLANGQQFVAYGIHPDTGLDYVWNTHIEPINMCVESLPEVSVDGLHAWLLALVDKLEKYGAKGVKYDGARAAVHDDFFDEPEDDNPFAGLVAPVDEDMMAKLRKHLAVQTKYDPNDYDDWIKVGLACKAFHEERGLELWEEWSATGSYDGSACAGKWSALRGSTSGNRITEASILYAGNEVMRVDAMTKLSALIAGCDSVMDMEGAVATAIREEGALSKVGREVLLGEWLARCKEISKVSLPKALARDLLTPVSKSIVNSRAPAFCSGWVWLNDRDCFYDVHSKEEMSRQSFDANFTRELEMGDSEEMDAHRGASIYALNNAYIECFSRAVYMPHLSLYFKIDGLDCVNSFSVNSIPEAVDEIDEAGREAVAAVVMHLKNICGKRESEARVLMDFIAYCTQHMGKKINFAPLIQGFEGDGKSIIGDIITCCIGGRNVKPLSPKTLQGSFTGWAEGHCVVVLEELRIVGHNRFDVLDVIKPMITNKTIDIRRMRRDNYTIVNVTNYIAFTNYRDALPLNDHDRRWFVIFSPYNDRADMEKDPDIGNFNNYFSVLTEAVSNHGGAIRRFFLDYQISPDFKPWGHAPTTAEKLSMIEGEKGDQLGDLIRFINYGGVGFSNDIISSSLLMKEIENNAFSEEYDFPDMNSRTMGEVFKKLGYIKVINRIKWNGEAHRVWVRSSKDMDNDRCRELLEETRTANEF